MIVGNDDRRARHVCTRLLLNHLSLGTAQHRAPLSGIGAQPTPVGNPSRAHWGEYPPIHVGQYPVDLRRASCFYLYEWIGRSGGAVQVDPVLISFQLSWSISRQEAAVTGWYRT